MIPNQQYVGYQGAGIMASGKQTDIQPGGSSNFANDKEKASEAGKKGGSHSHSGSQPQQSGSNPSGSGQQGGSTTESGGSRGKAGNFAGDREKASEAGKKGGAHSHDRK